MRNAGRLKLGHFPLPVEEARNLSQLLIAAEPFFAVDPCAGDGTALLEVTKDFAAQRAAIELDAGRAADASARGIPTTRGSTFESHLPAGSCSLLYLNPPYDVEVGNHSNQRLELVFLDHCYGWLKTAGVLIFVIPDNALSHCAKRLASQFERISVFRLTHPESVRFRQLAIIAIRKKEHHRGDTRYADQLLRLAYNSNQLPTLSSETTERFIVPESTNADDWNSLTDDLSQLASKSGQAMTRSAAERGVRRFSASLQRSIDERVRALTEPIASSEERILKLRQTIDQAEQWLRDLGALFSAEQMRLSMTLLARRKEFLKQVLPIAREEFEHETSAVAATFGPARRRELAALAQAIARRHVMPWMDTEEAQAEELYGAVTQRFVNLVNGLLQRICEEQGADISNLPRSLDEERGFRTRSRFFFHDMITIAQPPSPLLYLLDILMGALHVGRWFENDALKFLEHLLDTNASRVQGDVEQRVVESRLRLESDVRKLLREVSVSAEQALSKARELIAAGTNAVQNELERLGKLQEDLNY